MCAPIPPQYLCNGLEDDIALRRAQRESTFGAGSSEADMLVASSGKMVLLDKLLPKLKAEGHKVLAHAQGLSDMHNSCLTRGGRSTDLAMGA